MSPTLSSTTDWLMLGSGSHALALLDALRTLGAPPPRAVLDLEERHWGQSLAGQRVAGGKQLIPQLIREGCHRCVIGVGDEGDLEPRRQAYRTAVEAGLRPMIVREPTSIVSDSARIAAGTQIMAGAILSAECELGENSLLDSGAILQVRVSVGADSHIACGAQVLGGARIGDRTHIGAGTTILSGVQIGDDCLVGPGLVIQESMPSGSTAVGSRARIIEQQGWRMAG